MKEKLSEIFRDKKIALLALILAAGVIFLAVSEYSSTGTKAEMAASADFSYEEGLERRLEALLSRVEGVGEVKVMVTLSGPARRSGSTGTGVLAVNASGEETIPEVRGVSVVCRGAWREAVKKKVIDLLTGALDLSANRITVTE